MASLFDDYAVIAESGLFDPDYYIAANPDVAELDCDPLLHYLEHGAREMRNPNETFDAKSYLLECRKQGQSPVNPLLHYIGAKNNPPNRASTNGRGEPAAVNPELLATFDKAFAEIAPSGGTTRVTGAGWILAMIPIVRVEVTVGQFTTTAEYGLKRIDVAESYQQYPRSLQSGFSFAIEDVPVADTEGPVNIVLTITTSDGRAHRNSSAIQLTPVAATAVAEPEPEPEIAAYSGPPPMKLEVDTCFVDASGILRISGWSVCFAPIVSLLVYIDDQPLGGADFGQPRPDVGSAFPDYPGSNQSGFELVSDVSAFGVGHKMLRVQATASTGIIRDVVLPLDFAVASNRPAPSKDTMVKLFCDVTELTTDGGLIVEGWAVCAAETDYVKIELNGLPVGTAEVGRERADVGNLFPTMPHARRAGFSFRKMTSKTVAEGEHMIVLRIGSGDTEAEIPLPLLAKPAAIRPVAVAAASAPAPSGEQLKLNIDIPLLVGGRMDNPVRGNMDIAGWAIARARIEGIDILLNGEFLTSAYTGVRRLDVFTHFGDWPDALTGGFTALVPHRILPVGSHSMTVVLRDKAGNTAKSEFHIDVEEAPETDGPWSLKTKPSISETEINSRILDRMNWRPKFRIVLAVPVKDKKAITLARQTLASIETQVYGDARVTILLQGKAGKGRTLASELLNGFPGLADRVDFIQRPEIALKDIAGWDSATGNFLLVVKPGDRLGCNALMELALESGFHRDADFIYGDDRRVSPSSGAVEAFFKPDWSPDLLLSTNYIGRAWCVTTRLMERSGFTVGELLKFTPYDLTLRLTELTQVIRHVPSILFQDAEDTVDRIADKRALTDAVKRRGIDGAVEDGATPGVFRLKRNVTVKGMVSIIIPTMAARGLIKVCLDTLREHTAYRNFEIICIENIPQDQQDWKTWLRANSDIVIETFEPFNWSRFNNLCVDRSSGEFLLFLNDDIEILTPDWLDALLEHAQRPEVGIVGPQLLYPDRRVQHAGMFLAGTGIARHCFRYMGPEDLGYFGLARTQRNVIAVTGACLLTRRDTFEAIGRFNETHTVVNNDLDYCLRSWRAGYNTVYTPHTTLIHHEQASRIEMDDIYDTSAFNSEWGSLFIAGDPFFHHALSKDRDDFSFEWEPVETLCAGRPVYDAAKIERILIVKLDHIGDCITAMPSIRRLKNHFPQARFSVLTGPASKSIWTLEPTIEEVIEFSFFHAVSSKGEVERTEEDWLALEDTLKPYRFDLAIDLRKHLETRPVLQRTGARYTAGYDHKGKYPWLDIALEWSEDQASFRKRQHTGDDLNNLIDAVIAGGENDRAIIAAPRITFPAELTGNGLYDKPVVCIHPSAGNEMKQWPPDYFASLINQLIALQDVNIAIIGAPDDAPIAAAIMDKVERPESVWSMVGKLKLAELPAFIATCSLFVGNDSGPKHIAAGLGVPTIGIHSGTVDSREWGPMGALAVGIDRDMTCSPCYRPKLEDCHRGLACLRHILPGDVYRACRKLLGLAIRRDRRETDRIPADLDVVM